MPAVSRYACLIRESSRRLHPFVRIRGRRLSTSSVESRLPPSIWPCLQSHPSATYFCVFLITYVVILSNHSCRMAIHAFTDKCGRHWTDRSDAAIHTFGRRPVFHNRCTIHFRRCQSGKAIRSTAAANTTSARSSEADIWVSESLPRHRALKYRHSISRMPSTHSATITFYAVYTLLSARYLPIHHSLPSNVRTLGPSIVVPWAATIAISRIWLGHHTWPQVGAGSLLGGLIGLAWFTAWIEGLNDYGRILEETFLLPLQRLY